MDYPVPSFGPDPDMVGTARAIEIGEAAHSHKLIMGTAESQAKWHNVAKDTQYNFAPDLDEDSVVLHIIIHHGLVRLNLTQHLARLDTFAHRLGRQKNSSTQ